MKLTKEASPTERSLSLRKTSVLYILVAIIAYGNHSPAIVDKYTRMSLFDPGSLGHFFYFGTDCGDHMETNGRKDRSPFSVAIGAIVL